jgi:hypothetical protein
MTDIHLDDLVESFAQYATFLIWDRSAVEPARTASVAELATDAAITAEAFVRELKRTLAELGGVEVTPPEPPTGELERLSAAMRGRYDHG